MDRSPSPPTALPDASAAQIEEARIRLQQDARAAGVSAAVVDDVLAEVVEDYRHAHVQAFIGVLVERQVRESLGLRSVVWEDRSVGPDAEVAGACQVQAVNPLVDLPPSRR